MTTSGVLWELAVDLPEGPSPLAAHGVAVAALERLVTAAVWVDVGDPACDDAQVELARGVLRHAVVHDPSHEAGLARAALHFQAPDERPSRAVTAWAAARGAFYGEWLRRQLETDAPGVFEALTGFASLERTADGLRLGIARGPGLAPEVLAGLLRAVVRIREREHVAPGLAPPTRLAGADAEPLVAWRRLTGAVQGAAPDRELPRSVVHLAAGVALGAATDLVVSPAVERLALERRA